MRPTTATIRLGDIASNYQKACQLAPSSQNIAVIKSNAYGHGMREVARYLEDMVPVFAVAFMEEAVLLRDAGIVKPILVLQGINHSDEAAEAANKDFWLLIHEQGQLDKVMCAKPDKSVRVWLKLDTGMHRLGFAPDALDSLCNSITSSSNIENDPVLCTHLACADETDNTLTQQQVSIIRGLADERGLATSIANSAGIMFWPESHAQWNRPGYMLYGQCPTGRFDSEGADLHPAMTMASEIIATRNVATGEGVGYGHDWIAKRDSLIGTIAIGYGDGYPRHARSGTPVLVNGRRVPLTGRVSMDSISVDLTDVDKVDVGDPVELWGQNLSVNEVAAAAGTIGYELLAGLTGRVPLVFHN